MKITGLPALLLGALLGVCAVDEHFGPAGCIALAQSTAGSCVFRLACGTQNLSHVEFAFDCLDGNGGIVRHSYGLGGFEPEEEFDTDVRCKRCTVPAEAQLATPSSAARPLAAATASSTSAATAAATTKAAARTKAQQQLLPTSSNSTRGVVTEVQSSSMPSSQRSPLPPRSTATATATARAKKAQQAQPQELMVHSSAVDAAGVRRGGADGVVRYGPRACVSTYRSKEGNCVMATQCSAEEIQNYSFGLVCVDGTGAPVRHVFGRNSFDPVETFDTLIACQQCLGLEDIPEAVALNGQVLALSRELRGLEQLVSNLSFDVARLGGRAAPGEVEAVPGQASGSRASGVTPLAPPAAASSSTSGVASGVPSASPPAPVLLHSHLRARTLAALPGLRQSLSSSSSFSSPVRQLTTPEAAQPRPQKQSASQGPGQLHVQGHSQAPAPGGPGRAQALERLEQSAHALHSPLGHGLWLGAGSGSGSGKGKVGEGVGVARAAARAQGREAAPEEMISLSPSQPEDGPSSGPGPGGGGSGPGSVAGSWAEEEAATLGADDTWPAADLDSPQEEEEDASAAPEDGFES